MLKKFTEQELLERKFTAEEIRLLCNMERGGCSNRDGKNYEEFFGVYLMLKHRDNIDAYLSNCAQGYVDDWTVINDTCKYNYQLKNSKYEAGRFNKELKEKFQLQTHYDSECYKDKMPTHTLVFSNRADLQPNQNYISSNEIINTKLMYFPYRKTRIEMLDSPETQFRCLLESICFDSSQYETALRLIASVLGGDVSDEIGNLWKGVIDMAKPDIFRISFTHLPSVVETKCQELGINLSGAYMSYNGLLILITDKINKRLNELLAEQVSQCSTPKEFFNLLQTISSETIRD